MGLSLGTPSLAGRPQAAFQTLHNTHKAPGFGPGPKSGGAGCGVNTSAFPNSWKQRGLCVGEGYPLSLTSCYVGETKPEAHHISGVGTRTGEEEEEVALT